MCLNCEKKRDPDAYRPILPIRWTFRPKTQSWPKRVASLKKDEGKEEERCGRKEMSVEERAIESLVSAAERVAMEEWWI